MFKSNAGIIHSKPPSEFAATSRQSRIDGFTMKRRMLLTGAVGSLFEGCWSKRAGFDPNHKIISQLQAIESRANGKLGAYIFDPVQGTSYSWRENERFAHCSSFKMSLAAMILSLANRGEADLTEVLKWTPNDMLHVSPVTGENIENGLSVEDLAHATLVTSDNTAANVLLKRFGGPEALTRFWRSLGDNISQLDRYEPELNDTPIGTMLDTTTPKAMALTAAALIHGNALTSDSKKKLRAWMSEVRTGTSRIRAGFPATWQSGDKTGTGIGRTKHTYVDIAFGGPLGRAPLIVTAYFEPATLVEPMDPVATSALAAVGTVAASLILLPMAQKNVTP